MKNTMLLAGLVSCVMSVALGQTNLIVNGQFDLLNEPGPNGVGGWEISEFCPGILFSPAVAHDDSYYLALGRNSYPQTVYQTITIPTNTVAATLSYYFNVYSIDLSSSDWLQVSIVYPNDTLAATVDTETGASSAGGEGRAYYQLMAFDLTNWIGQTVAIEFQALASAETVFNIDDVAVWVETTADIPPNDYFTNRTVLTGTSLTVQGNNTFATTEPGERGIEGNPPFQSLWWSWTAPANGTLNLSTYASSFPNLLAVYTGSSITNLTQVAAAGSANESGNPAQVTCLVRAGTNYQIAVDGYQGAYGFVELALAFGVDTNPPAVSFSSPAANAILTNSTVLVQGTAKDKFPVEVVEYRLENAAGTNAYQPATGTTNWSATLTNLLPGLNTVRVFAIDISSNVSPAKARSFTYVVVTPLVLTTNGSGTLKLSSNSGTLLELNKTYSITATPANGSIFADWTDGAGNILATTLKLSFTMTTGLELKANFIPNPFIPLAGTYAGLFADTNRFSPASAGSFAATLTGKGGLTAQLQLAGGAYRFSGPLSFSGAYSNSVAGPGGGPLTLHLQLDLSGGQGLTGSVSNSAWSAGLAAYLAVSQANLAQAGKKYTLVMGPPDLADPSAGPGGYGFGTLSVNASGTVTFSGTLGDGTKVTAGGVVAGSDHWPLCLSPSAYAGKGLAWGWLSFATNSASQDVVGSLSWVKETGLPGKLYPQGFGFTNSLQVTESLYSYTNGARVLDWTNGVIELVGGNFYQPDTLSPGLTNGVTLEANNKLSATNKLSLTLTTASGLFQGTVPVPGTKTTIPVSGVLLQGGNAGYGLFLGSTNTGSVYLGE
jgi:hypothetical protein